MASHVVGVPTSGVAWDDDSGGTPALAVPVGSNPAYHARSMSLKRESQQQGEAASALSRRRVSRKVAPEGDEQQKANTRVGVSEAFLEDFLTRVLPQFGLTREALSTPKTPEEWLERLCPKEDVHRVDVGKAEVEEVLVDLGDGLQARKSDVEHVRKLVRLPRCRNKDWELVEAEVDRTKLPEEIDADTPLHVRVKGDPNAEWMTFLAARDVALVQTSDIVDFVIKYITQWKNGKLLVEKLETKKNKDGKDDVVKSERKTYVDHVADVHPKGREWVERNYFGKADIFVSHAWMDSYQDFSDAMTGGCSEGSKHYQNKLAGQVLGYTPLKNILDDYFRTWKKKNSAAWWQRSIALFVTSLILFPFNVIKIILTLSGISFVVRILPETWLKWTVTNMRLLDSIDRNRRWVDIFCKNQWVVNSEDTENELQDGVGNVDKLWLVTHSWHTPHALRRAWCQFELRAARLKKVGIVGIACEEEAAKLRNVCRAVLYRWWFWLGLIFCGNAEPTSSQKTAEYWRLKSCLHSVDARTAEARFDTDKEHILELIRQGVEDGDGGSSNERQQGEAAINAHNEELKESYLALVSTMMDGYVGGKVKGFLLSNGTYFTLILVSFPFFLAKTVREYIIWLDCSGLALSFIVFVYCLAGLVEKNIQLYYVQPLRLTGMFIKKNEAKCLGIRHFFLYAALFFFVLCIVSLIDNFVLDRAFEKCAAHPLASDPSLVPSCTFSALNTAPRDVREYRHHVIGTYYQMPNKTINGKPVFEAFNVDERMAIVGVYLLGATRKALDATCHKRYLYYAEDNKWSVGSAGNMELGKSWDWIRSSTTYVNSPAWLPTDERWRLWHDDEIHYGVVQLTCRNLPAAPPPSPPRPPPSPPPPPPPISTPACTFALRDDAPSAVTSWDHVLGSADHVLGTYYLMLNKTVNDRPVFELNRYRYLYYDEDNKWSVDTADNMEVGKVGLWWIIRSSTTNVDLPAWLPADERWELWHNFKTHYGVVQLTCRNMPTAPPPPPPPLISTPACTFTLRDDAPSAVKDADHVLGTYYLMSNNKTVNDRPVFELNRDRYFYYANNDKWVVGNAGSMAVGDEVVVSTTLLFWINYGWIRSSTTHVDSPAWLPTDERWRLWHDGEYHYGVLQLTCRHLPAAPPPPNSS